ncbi:hypothetical protein Tco_1158407 [Tanacetum coccineum]|uniref:Uncharacterized protein n=1 Tax=Tanacetum coccineum TaxID=301880 RepID=A0ABQ5GMK8_9ASTR
MPYDLPLSGGDTLGSDEGSKKLNELKDLCTKLFDKVTSLEQDLKHTKQVYGKALTKLVKKGRMSETEDEGFKHEGFDFDLDQTNILQHITPTKVPQDACKEKTFKSYTRRRSTDSSRVSTARDLLSTAKAILSTDEEIAQKLNEEEMAKAAAREEQERIDFEKAIELQK